MRVLLPLCLVAVLVLCVSTLARGDAETDLLVLRGKVETLELQVKLLTAREAAQTAYILANEQRSAGLAQTAREARALGFAAGAFPAASRERILAGMEAMARSLVDGLPVVTKDQAELQAEIERRLKAR
jgi:hypothetical protein